MGRVEIADGRLRATPKGRPVLNAVLREAMADPQADLALVGRV